MAAKYIVGRVPGPSLFSGTHDSAEFFVPVYFEVKLRYFLFCTAIALLLLPALLPLAARSSHAGVWESPPARFERLGPFGGEVRSVLIDPHDPRLVLLGTSDGQLFKSLDGGLVWEQIFPGLNRRHFAVDTLVAHPTEPGHMYAGGWDLKSDGGGLFESRDHGRTWTMVTLPQSPAAVRDFAISAIKPERMIVGTLDAALVSSDGGMSWRKVSSVPGGFHQIESVAIDPEDPGKVYIGTWRLSYRSFDFGRSWTRSENGMLFDSDVFSIAMNPSEHGVMYASACSGVYRSANRGLNWTRLRLLPDRFTVRSQVVYLDPTDPTRVYVGSTEGLFLSENDGQSWKRLTSSEITVNAIQVDPKDRRKILIGTESSGIMRSADGGTNWKESNQGFIHRQISRILSDPGRPNQMITGLLSEGARGGYYLYDVESRDWSSMTAGLQTDTDILSLLILPVGKGRIAGTGRGAFWQSGEGKAWTRLSGPITKARVSDLVSDSTNGWVYAATEEGVFRSRLFPLTFQSPVTCQLRPRVQSILVGPPGSTYMYAVSSMGIIRSRNQAANWEVASSGLPFRARIQSLAMNPSDRGHLLAGTTLGIFESRNAGDSWNPLPDPSPGIDIASVIFLQPDGNFILAADNNAGGVHISSDGGNSWTRLHSSGFDSAIRFLAQDPVDHSRVYMGTGSEGVYRLILPDAALSSKGRLE
jgi:photosystem II stability/assembly factor-like uncharacterized protein